MTLSRSSQRVSSIFVCELTTASKIQAIQRLRYSVRQAEGAVIHHAEREIIADHHDDHATHWGVFDGDQLVGGARLCFHAELSEAPDGEMFADKGLPTPIASMNRLVVLKTHRGRGIGSQLDEVRKAKEWEARAVIIAPANIAARRQALERRGFRFLEGVTGHPIWSPTVRVCACYLNLNTPAAPHD
jgi:GNAT superfamily N-acetyltransferase